MNTLKSNTEVLLKAKNGDALSEEIIVNENMGLIWSVVNKFSGRGYEKEDLFQIGAIGLIKAIKNFNPDYEVCFSTYAVPMILGEIRRFMRDDGAVKVSRGLKAIASKGFAAREKLSREGGREPTLSEIAKECGEDEDMLVQAFDAVTPPESIYASVSRDGGREICIADRLPAEDNEEQIINKVMIQNILDSLPPRERQIIIFRYFKNKTQSEISKIIGVSQVQVSRLEKAVLAKIRKEFFNDD